MVKRTIDKSWAMDKLISNPTLPGILPIYTCCTVVIINNASFQAQNVLVRLICCVETLLFTLLSPTYKNYWFEIDYV